MEYQGQKVIIIQYSDNNIWYCTIFQWSSWAHRPQYSKPPLRPHSFIIVEIDYSRSQLPLVACVLMMKRFWRSRLIMVEPTAGRYGCRRKNVNNKPQRVDVCTQRQFVQHSGCKRLCIPVPHFSCIISVEKRSVGGLSQQHDEAVRVFATLRLDLRVCVSHQCHCGSLVDARGVHSFICKKAPGRTPRHHALNDLIARSFVSAGIPVTEEPSGISRTDGNDTCSMGWRQTPDMGCHGCLSSCDVVSGCGGQQSLLLSIWPPNMQTWGLSIFSSPLWLSHWAPCMTQFLAELGWKISTRLGDDQESTFLFQHISVLLFHFNSILLHNSFVSARIDGQSIR